MDCRNTDQVGASPAAAFKQPEGSTDSGSATDRTISGIVAMIGAGELAPASRLPPEGELAALMGVSRGSLREAVRVLAHLGIVDVRVGDGTYVTDLDGATLLRGFDLLGEVANEKTALEIFEIRRILESAAAAIAASRITDEQLEQLEAHLDELRVESDSDRFVRLDIQFHDMIAAATRNVSLRMLCASFSARTQRARLMRAQNSGEILSRSTIEHDDIFHHIKDREPVLAGAAAMSHIANVERWLRHELFGAASATKGDSANSAAGAGSEENEEDDTNHAATEDSNSGDSSYNGKVAAAEPDTANG